jgi:hypothetical protein
MQTTSFYAKKGSGNVLKQTDVTLKVRVIFILHNALRQSLLQRLKFQKLEKYVFAGRGCHRLPRIRFGCLTTGTGEDLVQRRHRLG